MIFISPQSPAPITGHGRPNLREKEKVGKKKELRGIFIFLTIFILF